jgi:hypothetical protein
MSIESMIYFVIDRMLIPILIPIVSLPQLFYYPSLLYEYTIAI